MKTLTKLDGVLNKIIKVLLILLFTAMTVVIFMQIVYRYVLLKPIPWAEEVARYLFVWITFVGSSVAVKTKGHVGVEFLVDKLPKSMPKIALAFAFVLCAVFSLLMAIHGWTLVQRTGSQVSAAMRMPMSYAYLAVPVGFALMCKEFLGLAIKEIISIKANSNKDNSVDLRGNI